MNDNKHLKTSEIAQAVGVHPNTVRLYEEWGLLQPVPRNPKGYRLYTAEHLEQMRLARIALRCGFLEGQIRKLAFEVVVTAATGDLYGAYDKAQQYLLRIRSERKNAEEALFIAQKWVKGEMLEETGEYFGRSEASRIMEVSIDVVRNWERNGLISVSRSTNSYRKYGLTEIHRLKVIRTLRLANYSMMAVLRMMNHVDAGKSGDLGTVLDTPSPEEDIISATDRWISTLNETESDAGDVINQLEKMISIRA